MKASILAVLAAVLVALPASASDAVSLDQHVEYYVVRGLTEEAIANSLRRAPPRALDGFQGQATFVFDWDFDPKPATSRDGKAICVVRNARVEIEIEITLPRHPTIASAPADVQTAWHDFAAALETHEFNHAEDFAAIGSKIPAALEGMTGPCATLDELANAKAMDYVDLAQKAADDYDAETNHGETEGTVFPGL
jgi:predicted secreted Zn-dependent protease